MFARTPMHLVCVSALLSCTLAVSTATGTTIAKMNVHDFVLESGLVVIGTVQDVSVVVHSEIEISTQIVLGDLEVLSGSVSTDTIVIEQSGGPPGSAYYSVHGMPSFKLGQRGLLFLRLPCTGVYMSPLVGWNQGRLIATTDPSTGEDIWITSGGRAVLDIVDGSYVLGSERLPIPGDPPAFLEYERDGEGPLLVSFADGSIGGSSRGAAFPQKDRRPMAARDLLTSIQQILTSPDPALRLFDPAQYRHKSNIKASDLLIQPAPGSSSAEILTPKSRPVKEGSTHEQ